VVLMMNLTDAATGCWIDGSHRSSLEFTALVIELAHDYGFELEWDQFVADLNWLSSDEVDDERHFEIMEALDWTYEDALDYLNENTRPGFVWVVRDQSLFLMTDEEADD
jgi:hypothetical protein